MTDHRMWRRIAGLLMVCGLLLAACSSDSDSGDDAAPDETTAASDVDPNGILKLGYDMNQSGNAWNYNPLKIVQGNSGSNDPLWYLLYARLLRPTADGATEPDLATSVEIVDTNRIDIVLREGLTFSDGSPLDAEAVKASYEAVLAAQADNTNGYLPAFYSLKTVEVTGATTLTLGFTDGTAASWFDQYIPTFAGSVFKFGGDPNAPIGAGPFTLTAYETGQSFTYAKNPTYWNEEAIKFAGIEIQSVPFAQPNSGLAALQSGQIDVTFTEPSLLSSLGGNLVAVEKVSPNTSSNMHICKKDGPLADARVRQAINKGMNREAISEAVYFGTAEPATESWPEGHRLYNPAVGELLAFDPEGAKELLAEAGYADGLTIDMYPIQAFNLDEVAEVIQQQLKDIGITVNIIPTTDYVNQFLSPNKEGVGLYPSQVPGPQKLIAWTGESAGNVCDYQNDEVDQLVKSINGVSQQSQEAVDLWYQMDELVTTEALSGFIVFRADVAGYNSDVIGDMQPWPVGNFIVPDPWVSYIKN
ncbi:MAG TPA: ABC transporter substrate-binding protein [Acidimicrobiales bacterium]